ncbi:Hsp20/alpha crystallin family protein [Streptomyces sp. NBC_01092]|uniref:Hsp20/alpha crystallin family protein n=1 Tax=Streptomyces sp. NBC_01092 TaxID=2903748 RepID=UPI003868C3D7|nr:HSP20 family small heat-shock protein [Streptomyces sp. NBC_01092]
MWSPRDDVEETEDAYLVVVDMLGARKGQVEFKVADSQLSIHGEAKDTEHWGWCVGKPADSGASTTGSACPVMSTPVQITAELSDGVRTVQVPKAEEARARHIEVTSWLVDHNHTGPNGQVRRAYEAHTLVCPGASAGIG